MAAACTALVVLWTAACSSDAGSGPTSGAGTAAATTTVDGATTAPPSESTGAPTGTSAPSTPDATGAEPAPLCPTAGDTTALTGCLGDALATYWTARVGGEVSEHVVLHPVEADIPKGCRSGLTTAPAFTCPTDGVLYFTEDFVASLQKQFAGPLLGYAFAVVQAHEMGHVVQLHVHQPQIEQQNPDPDTVKFVEQQADCLSGVWAHAAQGSLGLDVTRFRAVAGDVLSDISDAQEIASHGTPAERLAAIDRGLHGSGPAACQLKTSG